MSAEDDRRDFLAVMRKIIGLHRERGSPWAQIEATDEHAEAFADGIIAAARVRSHALLVSALRCSICRCANGVGAPFLDEHSSRAQLIRWLEWNDRNGIYSDAALAREEQDPLTQGEAWKLVEVALEDELAEARKLIASVFVEGS